MSTTPANEVIAHTLQWLAVLLEIDGGPSSRIAAYRHAAAAVKLLEPPVAEVVQVSGAAGLEALGLTPSIAAMVTEWIRTGRLPHVVGSRRRDDGLWPALTRALCGALGVEPKDPKEKVPPSAPRPIHRAVWDSWH